MGAFQRNDKDGIADDMDARLRALPAPRRAPHPEGRHALGRRAADVRDGPGAARAAAPAAARRAVDGTRAGARRAHLRGDRRDQPAGHDGAAGRAERAHGARDRAPRLRARNRRASRSPTPPRRCAATRPCARPTSARTEPQPHTPRRIDLSARWASSASCVAQMTAARETRAALTSRSATSAALSWSSRAVGSSSSTTSGWRASARAIATRWRSPAERRSAARSMQSARPSRSSQARASGSWSGRRPPSLQLERRARVFSSAVANGTSPGSWPTQPTWSRRCAASSSRSSPASSTPGDRRPSRRRAARARRCRCRSVVLPEPERPSTATSLPRAKLGVEPVQHAVRGARPRRSSSRRRAARRRDLAAGAPPPVRPRRHAARRSVPSPARPPRPHRRASSRVAPIPACVAGALGQPHPAATADTRRAAAAQHLAADAAVAHVHDAVGELRRRLVMADDDQRRPARARRARRAAGRRRARCPRRARRPARRRAAARARGRAQRSGDALLLPARERRRADRRPGPARPTRSSRASAWRRRSRGMARRQSASGSATFSAQESAGESARA